MKEIAAFGTFLEQFHQKQQQNAKKPSQDTNHQLTKNASPETVSDEWMEENVKLWPCIWAGAEQTKDGYSYFGAVHLYTGWGAKLRM